MATWDLGKVVSETQFFGFAPLSFVDQGALFFNFKLSAVDAWGSHNLVINSVNDAVFDGVASLQKSLQNKGATDEDVLKVSYPTQRLQSDLAFVCRRKVFANCGGQTIW